MNRYRQRQLIVLLVVALAAGSATAASYIIFQVNTIEYIGDDHYSDEELTQKLFDGQAPNALYYFLFKQNHHKVIPFIQKYEVEIRWPSKMVVTVYEKPVIGYVSYMGCNMYFDKDGIVVESSTKILSDVPQISGLKFTKIVLGEKLEVENGDIFMKVLELTQGFDKYQIMADKIFFDSDGIVTLTLQNVKVLLGSCENLTDTLYELRQMLPQLEGMKGTLHLENFSSDRTSIIFQEDT